MTDRQTDRQTDRYTKRLGDKLKGGETERGREQWRNKTKSDISTKKWEKERKKKGWDVKSDIVSFYKAYHCSVRLPRKLKFWGKILLRGRTNK